MEDKQFALRLSIFQKLLSDGVISQSQYVESKDATKEEIFGENGCAVPTPRVPQLPHRVADDYVKDFQEKLSQTTDLRRSKKITRRFQAVKKTLEIEIEEKEKEREQKYRKLERTVSQRFIKQESTRKRIELLESEVERLKEEVKNEEMSFQSKMKDKFIRQKYMNGRLDLSGERMESLQRDTSEEELSDEEAEYVRNVDSELLRLEAEVFDENFEDEAAEPETLEEISFFNEIEGKKRALETKEALLASLIQREHESIEMDEAEIRRLEKELLLAEQAFDEKLEAEQRRRKEDDDYDWDDIDPLDSDEEDDDIQNEVDLRHSAEQNADIQRLSAEIFGDDN